MEVATLFKFPNFGPLVLCDVVHLAFTGRVVWILASNCIDIVLGLKVVPSVEMRKLVSALAVFHRGLAFNLIRLLVQNETVVSYHCSDFVLFKFATDHEDFVLCLNAGESFGNHI